MYQTRVANRDNNSKFLWLGLGLVIFIGSWPTLSLSDPTVPQQVPFSLE